MSTTSTALEVFTRAMNIMGELNSSGAADTSDTAEYKNRTLEIINVLGGELFPLSDTYTVVASGTRPVFTPISDFSSIILIDDSICLTVMPYGLAAHLLLDENPNSANFFQQRYEQLKAQLSTAPAEFTPITNAYGDPEYNEYSSW